MYKKLLIFIPHIGGGGVEKNFFLLSNYLADKINSVSVITINKEFKKKLNKKIKIISPKSNKWKNSPVYLKYFICIIFLIKTLLTNKKYLILSFQANWYAIIIAKIFNNKIVSRSNTAPSGWSQNILKNYLYKFVLSLADEITVNSIEFQKLLKKKFNVNSTYIYNPINKNEILRKSRASLDFDFFNNKKLKLINVGRCTEQKNQMLILKAIKYLKGKVPIKLLIAGRGKEFKNLKNYINLNNLKKNVKLLDFLQNPHVYIKKSDVFILSSNYEGLPNVLLETQCLKKIILSTKCHTGPKEILLNGNAGIFFKTNNYKDLAHKIEFIYNNKKAMKKKSIIGYNNLNRFDEKTNLNKYYLVLKKYLY